MKTMRNMLEKTLLLAVALLFSMTGTGCSSNDTPTPEQEKTYDMSGFAKGADVSWLTEMEAKGVKFYNANGKATECMSLLRDLGMNAVRLRVWVNPDGGWCGKDDVMAKAWRAQQLGMRLMIDFHYSDTWADPANQKVPAAWQSYSFDEMKQAIAEHTTDVLTALKTRGVDVEWVQVGNETTDGMLWNDSDTDEAKAVTGRASKNMTHFAAYVNAGYDAVKAVYPQAKVVVHLDKGNNLSQYTWLFDGLKQNGGKWDVIGMSLYPDWITDQTWEQVTDDCLSNIQTLASKYSCDVVVSEIGMVWNSENAALFLKKAIEGCKAIAACEGVFYWEPESYNAWNGYDKGAFDNSGKPTSALEAFQ